MTETAPPSFTEVACEIGAVDLRTDAATLGSYARSTSATPARPAAIAFPRTAEEVASVLRALGRRGLKAYAISRGKNWGYGDAAPAADGHVVLDLSRMDRIHAVDESLGYAVIEPGVTQKQLHEHLARHAPSLMIDATGATVEASFVGNTVDRGFGHTPYGDHCGNACAMQVVLGDGRVLDTGYARFPGGKAAHVYRYGVGPSLDGLFSQSNFGVVTRLTVWLMRRPEAACAFLCSASDEALPALLDAIAGLRRRDLVRSAAHIGNDLRVISARRRYPFHRMGGATPLSEAVRAELRREAGAAAWNAAGMIYGTAGVVRAVKREVRRALRGFRPVFLDDRRLRLARRAAALASWTRAGAELRAKLDLFAPVYGLMLGVPTDEAVAGAYWRVRGDAAPSPRELPDSPAGLMWVSPVLPATGAAAREVLGLVTPIYHAHGFDALVTFTLITERAAICVTNVAFDRREPEETRRAHACYHALWDALLGAGYVPYRAGHAGQARLAGEPSVFNDVLRDLKGALDPLECLAPGRYVPPLPGRVAADPAADHHPRQRGDG